MRFQLLSSLFVLTLWGQQSNLCAETQLRVDGVLLSSATTQSTYSTPLAFTPNRGEGPDSVLYQASSGGVTMWLTSNNAYYQFSRRIPIVTRQGISPASMTSLIQSPGRESEQDSIETLRVETDFGVSGPLSHSNDDSSVLLTEVNFDLAFIQSVFLDGGPDTLLFDNSSPSLAPAMGVITQGTAIASFPEIASGVRVCVDSSWFRYGREWKWDRGHGKKKSHTWRKKCYKIHKVRNQRPHFTNPPVSLAGSHCSMLTHTFTASDPEGDPFTFSLRAGDKGSITSSGVWKWDGATLADVGASINIHVTVSDSRCGGTTITVPIFVTNAGPTINTGCQTYTVISTGETKSVQLTVTDDCDSLTWSQVTAPVPTGAVSISNTGLVTFSPLAADGPNHYTTTVTVTDGEKSSSCTIMWTVIVGSPYALRIDTISASSGDYATIDVILERQAFGLGGFDFLVAYDNTILALADAQLGERLTACSWEYFTFRFGPNGDCSSGCPTSLIRFVGMAETNNGPYHPNQACIDALGGVALFTMNFLVSNNRTYECQFAPIRFFWLDCGDNSISNPDGSRLYVSCTVANFDNPNFSFADTTASFPTYLGLPHANCFVGFPNKPLPIRAIDFINGGIRIKCASELDARGDINLNGVSCEVIDAIMFTNYFVVGPSAFGTHVAGSTFVSDVNADGRTLTVADLLYLIRIVLGDPPPLPGEPGVGVTWSIDNGYITVDGTIGAAAVWVAGKVTPENLTTNMAMTFAYDAADGFTRILIHPPFTNGETQTQSFTGTFLNAGGNVLSIELATSEGAQIAPKVIPGEYALDQNYPNPFNPSTLIGFDLPVAELVRLEVFNTLGQLVTVLVDRSLDAGHHEASWHASGVGNGVYLYRLTAGTFTDTKKMVLLK